MRRKLSAALPLCLAAWLLVSGAPVAGPVMLANAQTQSAAEASAFVNRIARTALDDLALTSVQEAQRNKRFQDLMDETFDVQLISRFVLGRYWRQATEAERTEYMRLVRELIVQSYARRFTDFNGAQFRVTGTRCSADVAEGTASWPGAVDGGGDAGAAPRRAPHVSHHSGSVLWWPFGPTPRNSNVISDAEMRRSPSVIVDQVTIRRSGTMSRKPASPIMATPGKGVFGPRRDTVRSWPPTRKSSSKTSAFGLANQRRFWAGSAKAAKTRAGGLE